MATVAVKGINSIRGHYCKVGYTIVRRYVRNDKPNDAVDCFEILEHTKSKKQAEAKQKSIQKQSSNPIEIIEYKSKDD